MYYVEIERFESFVGRWPVSSDEGICNKNFMKRLRKLLDYRLITRTEILEKVPRTEYALTATGEQLSVIIEKIRDLDEEHGSAPES